jgi:hypothetical protein
MVSAVLHILLVSIFVIKFNRPSKELSSYVQKVIKPLPLICYRCGREHIKTQFRSKIVKKNNEREKEMKSIFEV